MAGPEPRRPASATPVVTAATACRVLTPDAAATPFTSKSSNHGAHAVAPAGRLRWPGGPRRAWKLGEHPTSRHSVRRGLHPRMTTTGGHDDTHDHSNPGGPGPSGDNRRGADADARHRGAGRRK